MTESSATPGTPLDTPILFAATDNPAAALTFYRDVLGLQLIADEHFAIVMKVGSATLRIQKVDTTAPPPYTSLGWLVSDMAGTVDTLTARGVVFERFPGMEQDSRGIWHTPDGAQIAWFRDPGNALLSLTQAPA